MKNENSKHPQEVSQRIKWAHRKIRRKKKSKRWGNVAQRLDSLQPVKGT